MLTYADDFDCVRITIHPHGFEPWSLAPRWRWEITVEAKTIAKGDDFRTPGKDLPAEALHVLHDFLTTWWEACQWEETHETVSENAQLFPDELRTSGVDWTSYLRDMGYEVKPASELVA